MKKRISIFCVIAVLCCMAIFLVASAETSTEHDVSWKVHGTWITAEGELLDTVEFSVDARIEDFHAENELDKIEYFLCKFPDDFQYTLRDDKGNYSSLDRRNLGYYGALGGGIDRGTSSGTVVHCYYAVDIEKEYVFIKWGRADRDDKPILVASVDPNVDPKEILEHFDDFLDTWYYPF